MLLINFNTFILICLNLTYYASSKHTRGKKLTWENGRICRNQKLGWSNITVPCEWTVACRANAKCTMPCQCKMCHAIVLLLLFIGDGAIWAQQVIICQHIYISIALWIFGWLVMFFIHLTWLYFKPQNHDQDWLVYVKFNMVEVMSSYFVAESLLLRASKHLYCARKAFVLYHSEDFAKSIVMVLVLLCCYGFCHHMDGWVLVVVAEYLILDHLNLSLPIFELGL